MLRMSENGCPLSKLDLQICLQESTYYRVIYIQCIIHCI